MHRKAKFVLITSCAGLLLFVLLFQLQGGDTDGTANVLQLQGGDTDGTANVLQPNLRSDNTDLIKFGTFQKPQPNNRNDNTGPNRQEAFQAPPPNHNKASAAESKLISHQIFQQSQPNFSHNLASAADSRQPSLSHNLASMADSRQQVSQQSQPSFSHNLASAAESRQQISQQSQPNFSQNLASAAESRQQISQQSQPNFSHNLASAAESRQISQQSQPNFSHNLASAAESRQQISQQSQPNLGRISSGQKAPEMFPEPPPELPSQPVSKQVHQMVPPLKNPVPPHEVLQNMSHKDIQTLYHSYVNSPQVTCSWVERMGKLTDGGWELCDDPLYRPLKGDCLVYSYGINFDFSYDDDMAKYGCEVHAFDPSMNIVPQLQGEPGKSVFFHPSGVGGKTGAITVGPKVGDQWQLYTIGDHRKLLHHTPDKRRLDIVKMDVEGQELESLMAALDDGSLADVRQLNFETHVGWSKNDPSKEEYLKFLALFRKVYEKGFRIYVTHRNYVWSAFESLLFKGKSRAHCHEVHTININFRNTIRQDGAVVGDAAITDATRQQRHSQQLELLEQEKVWYQQFRASKVPLIKKAFWNRKTFE